jgi:hypothetical protein
MPGLAADEDENWWEWVKNGLCGIWTTAEAQSKAWADKPGLGLLTPSELLAEGSGGGKEGDLTVTTKPERGKTAKKYTDGVVFEENIEVLRGGG